MKKLLKQYWGLFFSCIFITFFVFPQSLNALWIGDEILYRFHFRTGTELSSFKEIFASQAQHYMTMNGRLPAHFLVQFVITHIGQIGFALANVIVWLLLLFLMLRICRIRFNDSIYVLLITLLLILGIQTKFVPTCQIGYVWMFTIVVGFLLLFFSNSKYNSKFSAVGLALYSFLAGWSQEAIVVGVSVSLIIYVVANYKKVSFHQWTMFFAFGIGAVMLCLSPANFIRTDALHGSVDFLPPFVYSLAKMAISLRVSYILAIYVFYLIVYRRITIKELYSHNSFYINSLLTLFVFNVLIGVFGNRQLFGIELMSMILLCDYIKKYSIKDRIPIVLIYALSVWGVIHFMNHMILLEHENNIYDTLIADYNKSDDGVVYYDFAGKDVTFKETYPSDVFTPWTISTIDRYLRCHGNASKPLLVLPTCCKCLDADDNTYYSSALDAYQVIILKNEETAVVTQKRNIRLMWLTFSFKERRVDMQYPSYENDKYKLFTVYDKIPFIKTESFYFE